MSNMNSPERIKDILLEHVLRDVKGVSQDGGKVWNLLQL